MTIEYHLYTNEKYMTIIKEQNNQKNYLSHPKGTIYLKNFGDILETLSKDIRKATENFHITYNKGFCKNFKQITGEKLNKKDITLQEILGNNFIESKKVKF